MEGVISAISYDSTSATASMTVDEGSRSGNVEYNATVPLRDDSGKVRAPADLRLALFAALRLQRASQIPPPPPDLGLEVGEHVDLGA